MMADNNSDTSDTDERDTIMRSINPGTTTAERSGIMKAFLLTLLLAGGTILLAGCNTMEGLGKDTQAAGEALEEEAQDAN